MCLLCFMILLIVFYVLTAFSRVCLYYKPTYVGFALSTSSIFVITTEGEGKRNVRGGKGGTCPRENVLYSCICLDLRLKTHGVENRRRFSTQKTDMADKVDVDAVAAELFISVIINRNEKKRKRNRNVFTVLFTNKPNVNNKRQPIRPVSVRGGATGGL